MIEAGMMVTPIRTDRLQHMNREFNDWMADNIGRRFYVERVNWHGSVKLAKVKFWLSQDFLEEVT